MNRKLLLLSFFLLSGNLGLRAQQGKVIESLEFRGKILNYPVRYSIYLPPDYSNSQRSYPVLYLLHGYSDDETGWIQFGEANRVADQGIGKGDFPPCVIVMPDGKVTWYVNNFDGSDRWEDMFINEFMPFIEKEYRIRPKKEFRAIAGLSMGGYGALMFSMRYPDLFSTCVALSSGTLTDEEVVSWKEERYNGLFGSVFGKNLQGNERLSENWKIHNPIHLLGLSDQQKLKSVRFYIDCGDDDFLYKGNSNLHILMRDKGIPHEYRVRNGGHVWEYWRTGLYDGLKYAGEKFHR